MAVTGNSNGLGRPRNIEPVKLSNSAFQSTLLLTAGGDVKHPKELARSSSEFSVIVPSINSVRGDCASSGLAQKKNSLSHLAVLVQTVEKASQQRPALQLVQRLVGLL